jgi:urease gamma subunit
MRLTGREIEKTLLLNAGAIAQKRLASGIRLNIPETIALLASQIVTLARMGKYSVAVLMEQGRNMLGTRQVIPGVEAVVDEVQVQTI